MIDYLNTGLTDLDIQMMNDNLVDYRKQLSTIFSRAKLAAKGDTCYYCGRKVSSFCNSHNIPQFCLKNIDENGKLKYFNEFMGMPLLDGEKGINNAGTFHIICKECDAKIFQEYENPDNYSSESFKPTEVMIAEIAMKNYLKVISKRKIEVEMYRILDEETPLMSGHVIANKKNEINDLDLVEYSNNFNKAKRVTENIKNGQKINEGYEVVFSQKLDYVVPIAFQGCFAMVSDFIGDKVNDVYNKSPNYHPRDIHLAVLPMKSSSIILMFVDSHEKVYRNFIRSFKHLSDEDKLGVISYLIFLYTEDYFVSPEASSAILNNKELRSVFANNYDAVAHGWKMTEQLAKNQASKVTRERMRLDKWKKFPCVFDRKYSIG